MTVQPDERGGKQVVCHEIGTASTSEVSTPTPVVSFVALIVRYARAFVIAPMLAAVIAMAVGYWMGYKYVSTTVLKPQLTAISASGLASVASQFGFSLAGLGSEESLDFYVALVRSRSVLESVALTEFAFSVEQEEGADRRAGTLAPLLGIEEDDPEERLKEAVEWLEDAVRVSADLDAGFVTIEVTAPGEGFSEQLGRRLLEVVSDFNLGNRQNRAQQERIFVEDRMHQARKDLEAAEQAMEAFLDSNRLFRSSPQLTFEHQRLQRRLDLQQQLFVSLSQAYEQARIEEVRNTPVLTVIEPPEGSAEIATGLVSRGLFGFAAGLLLVATAVVLRELLARFRTSDPDEYQAVVRLLRPGKAPPQAD